MSSLEDERLLKQKFLRVQIIDQGYDAMEFSEYIGKKKEEGSWILKQEWTSITGLMMNWLQ